MWTEPILHVDMDSFFVEVERLRRPELRGRPVAVGGTGRRGVVASSSYEARKHGVHSAQPTSVALRLCPQLEMVPPDHERYVEVSADVFAVFRSFTPLVEGLSLDEAFLDVSGLRRHLPSPVSVAEAVRARIRTEVGLPASVGVASVKFIAKLASYEAKPDGVFVVPSSRQLDFLHALPVSAMWGVGPATQAALSRLGVETIGDIAGLPEASLVAALGPSAGRHLHELSRAHDPRPVVPDTDAKSVSVEETYPIDLEGSDAVEAAILAHAHRLSSRLRRSGLRARTVTLKVRFSDFETVTRSHTEADPIDGSRAIHRVAVDLLASVDLARPIRLLGIGAGSLEPSAEGSQLELGADPAWDRVEDAVAGIRRRFGDEAVRPARLAGGLKSGEAGTQP